MNWIVFSYTLPSKASSSPRVALWRRLRRLGAIAPAGGVQVLPARDECVEAFQWLAQEIRQAGGDAVVMRVAQFEGVSDQQLITLFHTARKEEYDALDAEATVLEQSQAQEPTAEEQGRIQDTLAKLRRRYADIARVDYFNSPEGAHVAAHLARIAQALAPSNASVAQIPAATLAAYQNRHWVTRPRPHVDRLACAWLIRRFIDPNAIIRYSNTPEPEEVAFDMNEAEFGHIGRLCTFETMVRAFHLTEPGLQELGELVHEIDLRDGLFVRPEAAGVDAVLTGWLQAGLLDGDLETHGIVLLEGLYLSYRSPRGENT